MSLISAPHGDPIATLHDDGYWTHPPGRDPLPHAGTKMDVYGHPITAQAPQPTDDQIQDLGFSMLPNVTCGDFTAFARAILALSHPNPAAPGNPNAGKDLP